MRNELIRDLADCTEFRQTLQAVPRALCTARCSCWPRSWHRRALGGPDPGEPGGARAGPRAPRDLAQKVFNGAVGKC